MAASSQRLGWVSFVKTICVRDKCKYNEALKRATSEWTAYKKDFAEKNPEYNHQAALDQKRKERKEKEASGELEVKRRRVKKGRGMYGKKKGSIIDNAAEEKEKGEEDEGLKGYDEVEKKTTVKIYRKRKRDPPAFSPLKEEIDVGGVEVAAAPPKPKRKRKNSTPSKRLSESSKKDMIEESSAPLKEDAAEPKGKEKEEDAAEPPLLFKSMEEGEVDEGENKENVPPASSHSATFKTSYLPPSWSGGYNLM
jgi:hypothetical protein